MKSEVKRRSKLVPAVVVLVVAALLALIGLPASWYDEYEYQAIRFERLKRKTYAGFGLTLSGTPDLGNFKGRLEQEKVSLGAPVFIRIFKREFELELWLMRDGRFHRFATYPICRWSGELGPKLRQGDGQAPEGFYTVDATALNPKSRWHRSFNLGFPNAFDRARGRTGSLLMVHGGCSSIGCYAMTNPVIDEIWELVTKALANGQKRFQVQVFPFRMTAANLERHKPNTLAPFWEGLKEGHDLFETDFVPPKVNVCKGRYTFEAGAAAADGSAPIETKCPPSKPAT